MGEHINMKSILAMCIAGIYGSGVKELAVFSKIRES